MGVVCAAGIALDTELMTRYSIRLIVGHDGWDEMYVDLNVDHNEDHLSIYVEGDLDFENVNQFAEWLICIKGRIQRLRRKLERTRLFVQGDIMMWRVAVSDLKDGDFVVHPYMFVPLVVVSVGRKSMLLQRADIDDTLTVRGDDLEMEWPRPPRECYERLRRIERRLSQLFMMRPYVHTVYPSRGMANADLRRIPL